jgi:Uma2 family endonuclease
MPAEKPRILIEINYHQAAQEYVRKLPLEHHMEATPQATQREITLESLALVRARRPEVQVFNELLVQYPLPRRKKPGQVVPDNMVVVWNRPIRAEGSYDVPLQPVGPLWVLEYVSKNTKRKDYDDSFNKYEQDLRVPYYLLFVPDSQEMTLYRHTGEKYAAVVPDDRGRCPLPELELEVGLHAGWVRYWFRGELLPLPADLLRQVDEERTLRLAAEAKLAEALAEVERLRRERESPG